MQYTGGRKGAADTSKSKIVIGWTNQQGGPADPSPFATDGAKLAVKYVDEELGGVDGHPIELSLVYASTTEEQGQSCRSEVRKRRQRRRRGRRRDVHRFSTAHGVDERGEAHGLQRGGGRVGRAEQERLHPVRRLIRVLPPLATFSEEVLKAKTAAVIYPEAPGVSYAADALTGGLKAAGLTYKRVSYPANATDLVAPLAAAGAQTADVVNPVVLPPQCVTVAKALQQSKVTALFVATPLCLNSNVAKALGDLPQWYYGIAAVGCRPTGAIRPRERSWPSPPRTAGRRRQPIRTTRSPSRRSSPSSSG